MPTLHRLATLRDDVIFFVYIYQSYKYKVDYNRVNEFGQGGEEEELEAKTAAQPLKAPADADTTAGSTKAIEDDREQVKANLDAAIDKDKNDLKAGVAKVTGTEKGRATKRK